jgi:class 3 adenylate cyclase/HAMP domain-containing protein
MLHFKLKTKLLLALFSVTAVSAIATTTFSIYYFSDKIKQEALQNLRNTAQIAELVFTRRIDQLREFTTRLSEEGTFKLLVDLELDKKLQLYLEQERHFIADGEVHSIAVLTPQQNILANLIAPQYENKYGDALRASTPGHKLVLKTLETRKLVISPEVIDTAGGSVFAITTAIPVYARNLARTDTPSLRGVLLMRYIFNNNHTLAQQISDLLNVDTALFHNGEALSYSTKDNEPPTIDARIYRQLEEKPGRHELGNIASGAKLAEYKSLTDHEGRSLGVLSISIPAQPYVTTLQQAVFNLLAIMLVCIFAAGLLGYALARSILNPVSQLLRGVERITSGELTYEIPVELKDELGSLASAFNSMSRQLSNLFNTLEQRIQDATKKLQNTLSHLSAIIDNMADGLLVTDTNNKIIRANPALVRMFPECKEMIGKDCRIFGDFISKLASDSRATVDNHVGLEIPLGGGRFGHAVATAIIAKDSFADDSSDHNYKGSRYLGSVILIRDITKEKEIDAMLQNTIETLTRVGTALSAEKNLDKLLEMFVTEARRISNADGGTLYIVDNNHLFFEIVQNASMGMFMGGTSNVDITMPPLPLDENLVSAYAAIHKEVVYTGNIKSNNQFDFSGPREYERCTGYKTSSMLAVPLLDRANNAVGVLQLINPIDPQTGMVSEFSKNQTEVVYSLASQAAVAIENVRSQEKIERKKQAFERFVPTQFLYHLGKDEAEDIGLGDATGANMSVLFSDIRSFTSISETMAAQDIFLFLNDYLKNIGPSIVCNDGFIDKYIGDAIMALFPNTQGKSAHHAVAAAVGMVQALNQFNAKRPPDSQLHIGIGIHTGDLVLGTIGFKDRIESTVIGDTVNLASRMEGLTKQYGVTIGITEDTYKSLPGVHDFVVRELDTVQVKGKEQAVTIYEVINGDPDNLKKRKLDILPEYHEGLKLYHAKRWQEALDCFNELAPKLPDDKPIQLYQARCRHLLDSEESPDNWTGVTRLSQK